MARTQSPTVEVRCTADLLAAVPYLLGFHPAESAVVVGFRGLRVTFVARGDLPRRASDESATRTAVHMAHVVARQEIEAATVIGYGPAERVTSFVLAIATALRVRNVRVIDTLRVTDGRFWSYVCADPACCPPEGIPFDPRTSSVAVAAALAGHVALPDRATFVRQLAPVTGTARAAMSQATERAVRRLAALLDQEVDQESGSDPDARRALRGAGAIAIRQAVARHRDGGRLTDDEVAWLSVLLTHAPVRDVAWRRVNATRVQVELWSDVVRRAEPWLVAAPASLLAFAAWCGGLGALANLALDRALACDPGDPMTLLTAEALRRGLSPEALRRRGGNKTSRDRPMSLKPRGD
ncbi:MAG: DUF4192 domain-containing protein [Actinobacteria bacterium]|nr:MAG: DUF4192 domain-containing protein [Actinomycetota bacterium]